MSERDQTTTTARWFSRVIHKLRWSAWLIIILSVVVAMAYWVENWRGAKRFERVKRAWEARGGSLDWSAYIPAPIPDDSNVATHPFLKPLSERPSHSAGPVPAKRVVLPRETPPRGPRGPSGPSIEMESDLFGSPVDLGYWQSRLRQNTNFPAYAMPTSPAKDVLLALTRFQVELRDLHEALARPQCRFPLRYSESPDHWLIPHLGAIRGMAEVLQLQAAALIEEGRSKEAAEAVGDLFRLADTLKDEPIVISFLIRDVAQAWARKCVLQGVEKQCWTKSELMLFQQVLTKQDLLAEGTFTLRAELACQLRAMDLAWTDDDLFRKLPRGWLDQNKAVMAEFVLQFGLSSFDLSARRIFPGQLKAAEEERGRIWSSADMIYSFFGVIRLPEINRLLRRAAREQTANDLALLACAVERHRLDHGEPPKTLVQLIPDLLSAIPGDVMSGRPLNYRRGTDGECTIWSVGWNERDDGGVVERVDKRHIAVATSDWILSWKVRPP